MPYRENIAYSPPPPPPEVSSCLTQVLDKYFRVKLGPDITTPFPPGLSFACVAKLWSRAAHCASQTEALLLQPGACDDFMEKGNVLPQITSLSLLAVNILPCASAL